MQPIPLGDSDISYQTMTKIGKIEVKEVTPGEIWVVVSSFEFSDLPTCRMNAIRSMAWLRDVLEAQIRVQQLVNATVSSASN